MSSIELARLQRDFVADPCLKEEFEATLGDAETKVAWACGRGYELTVSEILVLGSETLSDDDLEMVAGGWTGDPPPPPGGGG